MSMVQLFLRTSVQKWPVPFTYVSLVEISHRGRPNLKGAKTIIDPPTESDRRQRSQCVCNSQCCHKDNELMKRSHLHVPNDK